LVCQRGIREEGEQTRDRSEKGRREKNGGMRSLTEASAIGRRGRNIRDVKGGREEVHVETGAVSFF